MLAVRGRRTCEPLWNRHRSDTARGADQHSARLAPPGRILHSSPGLSAAASYLPLSPPPTSYTRDPPLRAVAGGCPQFSRRMQIRAIGCFTCRQGYRVIPGALPRTRNDSMPGSSSMTSEMPGSRLEAGPASRVRDSAASVATAANGPLGLVKSISTCRNERSARTSSGQTVILVGRNNRRSGVALPTQAPSSTIVTERFGCRSSNRRYLKSAPGCLPCGFTGLRAAWRTRYLK